MAIEYKYSPEEFEKKVKAYHVDVETKQLAFPDLAGLKNKLAIEDDEYNAMFDDPAYHDTCLWAQRRRESFLNRAALTAKNTAGIKMLLAQPENGGYVEKPIDKTPRKVEVVLRGMPDDDDSDDDSDIDLADEPDSDSVDSYKEDEKTGSGDRQSPDMSGKAGRNRSRTKRRRA